MERSFEKYRQQLNIHSQSTMTLRAISLSLSLSGDDDNTNTVLYSTYVVEKLPVIHSLSFEYGTWPACYAWGVSVNRKGIVVHSRSSRRRRRSIIIILGRWWCLCCLSFSLIAFFFSFQEIYARTIRYNTDLNRPAIIVNYYVSFIWRLTSLFIYFRWLGKPLYVIQALFSFTHNNRRALLDTVNKYGVWNESFILLVLRTVRTQCNQDKSLLPKRQQQQKQIIYHPCIHFTLRWSESNVGRSQSCFLVISVGFSNGTYPGTVYIPY